MYDADVRHVNDIPWYEAKLPSRFHLCKTQTSGWVNIFTLVERCACGATRIDARGLWVDKNSRRR